MRKHILLTSVSVCILFGSASLAMAQWTWNKIEATGMFGRRSLGRSLQPSPSRLIDGLVRGPSGVFIGRGRPNGGMMFTSGIPRYWSVGPTDSAGPLPPLPPRLPEAVPLAEAARKAVAPPARVEPFRQPPPGPVGGRAIWFRAPQTGSESGSPSQVPSASAAPPAPARTPYPPVLRIGFAPLGPVARPGEHLTRLIRRSDRIRALSPITVVVDNQTAVLVGRVASQRDRKLAENLVRFEPGIWKIQNNLTVEPPALLSSDDATAR